MDTRGFFDPLKLAGFVTVIEMRIYNKVVCEIIAKVLYRI